MINGTVQVSLSSFHRLAILSLLLCALTAKAEQGFLVLYVTDSQDVPLSGVRISVKGDGSTAETRAGKARIRLAPQTQAKSWVTLAVLSPSNLIPLSPWDGRVQVPSFENESQNYVSIVLAKREDRRLLENPAALRAILQRVIEKPPDGPPQLNQAEQRQRLDDAARLYGLEPKELDAAILAWKTKSADPFDKGLIEFYSQNYTAASSDLAESVRLRSQKRAAADVELLHAEASLGASLYSEGKYRASEETFEEVSRSVPDDPNILGWLGGSMRASGEYRRARPVLERALDLDETLLGADDPRVASARAQLGSLLLEMGDYARAALMFDRALEIDRRVRGASAWEVGGDLMNLALLAKQLGNYAEADRLAGEAYLIAVRAHGPQDLGAQEILYLQIELRLDQGDVAGAEVLAREVLPMV